MADSDALRQRRRKAHTRGDHSLCRRCDEGKPGTILPPIASLPDLAAPGKDLDAATEMRDLASRLADAHRAEPSNAMIARELRITLQALGAGKADDGLGGLDEALREA